MMMKSLLSLLLLTAPPLHAVLTFVETPATDLGTQSAPTSLGSLGTPGKSTFTGTINEGGTFNADSFTFSVPSGQTLTSAVFSSLAGASHFFGFDNSLANPSAGGDFLVATLVGNTDVGANLLALPTAGQSFSGSGATLPLPAGNYIFWLQETSNATAAYTFELTTVPEPTSAALVLGALLTASRRRRAAA